MKRKLKVFSVFLIAILILSGCKMSFDDEETTVSGESQSQTENTSARKAKVEIIQYLNYKALNECCEGITQTLDEDGIEYEVFIGSDSSAEDDCSEKAKDIVINNDADLIITIGTPASVAVFDTINGASKIPVIFCAVTDPVGAKLVKSGKAPSNNCTGVCTYYDMKQQLNMINTFQPEITRLGVIYSKNEQSTEKQLKTLKEEATKLGITIFDGGVDSSSELQETAQKLVPEVEAIALLPENTIGSNAWEIINQAVIGDTPVYGVCQTQINEGCIAGFCHDFHAIGKSAAETAEAVLRGQSASEKPVVIDKDMTLYVNKDVTEKLEIKVPKEYSNAVLVATSFEQ